VLRDLAKRVTRNKQTDTGEKSRNMCAARRTRTGVVVESGDSVGVLFITT
jgi:hypothetical protein